MASRQREALLEDTVAYLYGLLLEIEGISNRHKKDNKSYRKAVEFILETREDLGIIVKDKYVDLAHLKHIIRHVEREDKNDNNRNGKKRN